MINTIYIANIYVIEFFPKNCLLIIFLIIIGIHDDKQRAAE